MEKQELLDLIDRYLEGESSEVENLLLINYSNSFQNGDAWDEAREGTREVLLAGILQQLREEIDPIAATRPVHRVHFLKTTWFRYAAAIILLLGAVTIALFMFSDHSKPQLSDLNKPVQTDVAPGGERAILTLADGRKIALDSAANGHLASQGGVRVVKLANGQISYDLRGVNSGEVMWNTMSTPQGGQYQVTLPDGTRVWLNASSSITFPTIFTAASRSVKVTGEIYFEVAKNEQKPFVVDVNGKSVIQVLGTSFNINSYANEESIKTTLLEGSVSVSSTAVAFAGSDNRRPGGPGTNGMPLILKPGQQAVQSLPAMSGAASSERELKITSGINVAQVLAWKNGIFDFTGADLKTVMRQLERWYDIKVRYKGSMSNMTFKGRMYRNVNLSDVLEVLQKMGVKSELDGRNLIVL